MQTIFTANDALKAGMCDLVIVGGGPAGMSAAVAAYDAGVRSIVILEREDSLGGILRQCIHNGFGLHRFGEELTGPEYAYRYEKMVEERNIPYLLNTTVIEVSADKTVTATSPEYGIFTLRATAVILAMGCRERPRGALSIPGARPAGIYTAGTAQKYVNMKGYMPGKEVVILGSGDIGLIMARRMTLEGAKVKAVCELNSYSGGLARNIEQCLKDFGIPLLLSHTVINIEGRERVKSVTIARVDEGKRPIPGTEQVIPCDTLLLSCGLIPENELTRDAGALMDPITGGAVVNADRESNIPGIFACGNVLHVHDLVDYVSEESVLAGEAAARLIKGEHSESILVTVKGEGGVRYTVPQRLTEAKDTVIYFRVADIYKNKRLIVRSEDKVLLDRKKLKLAPGEMETVTVKGEDIATLDGKTLTVVLEDM